MATENRAEAENVGREHFTRLYDDCAAWLYSYLLSLLHRPLDAEEVLQETAKLCWEKFDQYQPGTEFRAWACRVAHFKAMKFRQRQQRSPLPFSDLFIEAVDEEAVVMADKLDARGAALAECLEKLPGRDRKLIDKRYANDVTAQQMATELGRSVHAVYRALRRIHGVLFRCINRVMAEGARS